MKNNCEDLIEKFRDSLQSKNIDYGHIELLIESFRENLKKDSLSEGFSYQDIADNSGIGKSIILNNEEIRILDDLKACLNN
jgi:hypothetical protein